jgi:transcriptional regulator with XRE-family HTH domain
MSNIDFNVKTTARRFTRNMNHLRKQNGLSYRGLARKIGVSDSTIRRIETARKSSYGRGQQGYIPSMRTLAKVAKATGMSVGELLDSSFQ